VGRVPGVEVQVVSVPSVNNTGAYRQGIEGILARAGVTKSGGVTGAHQRVVVAMPVGFGGKFKTSDVRALFKAGVKSGRILWFASAGNPGDAGFLKPDVLAPASYDEVVGVAGSSFTDSPLPGFSKGKEVDVAAAGECQIAPNFEGGNSYTNGSSGASVIAAALAARVWVANPTMHSAQVRRVLESATAQRTVTKELGWGVVDLDLVPPDVDGPSVSFKK
jgi:Subtilase family